MTDALHWYVAVASQKGHERLARVELDGRGFEVHVPIEYLSLKLTTGRKHVTADRMLLSPYFFVRFRGNDEEHSLAKSQRGVSHILTNSRGVPGIIPDSVIAWHRSREYAEQHNATKRREKAENTLLLNAEYRIIRGRLEGHTGTLIAVDRGIAHVDINGMIWMPLVCDLVLIQQKARAA